MFRAASFSRSFLTAVILPLRRSYIRLATLALGGLIAATALPSNAAVTGNLLTDPGFENNPLSTAAIVLNPGYPAGVWGAENATIVGPTGLVNPLGGTKMLSELDDGGVVTQTIQWADVSAYAAAISAGGVTADYSAWFNVDRGPAAAQAEIVLSFFDSTHTLIGSPTISGITLDTNPATWEIATITSLAVPVNTTYLQAQVAYVNSTMYDSTGLTNYPGYTDETLLTMTTSVPEPASLSLLAFGAIGLLRRCRATQTPRA